MRGLGPRPQFVVRRSPAHLLFDNLDRNWPVLHIPSTLSRLRNTNPHPPSHQENPAVFFGNQLRPYFRYVSPPHPYPGPSHWCISSVGLTGMSEFNWAWVCLVMNALRTGLANGTCWGSSFIEVPDSKAGLRPRSAGASAGGSTSLSSSARVYVLVCDGIRLFCGFVASTSGRLGWNGGSKVFRNGAWPLIYLFTSSLDTQSP